MKKYALILLTIGFLSFTSTYAQQTVGLFKYDSTAFDGYTLLTPFSSKNTYLLNNCGHVVNTWISDYRPGALAYLKPNGNLIRAAQVENEEFGAAGGNGGRIEEHDWDGNLVWHINLSTDSFSQHHDFEVMPNGNILVLIWKYVPSSEALAAGRDIHTALEGIWQESIWELEPQKDSGATVVWHWDAMDHVVQDRDSAKPNFGAISKHPELLDLNSPFLGDNKDWLHFNSVDYNAELDQVMISCHAFSEIYIIDHSTTTGESGGHFGGNHNKGGDILYRYGNPQVYGRGTASNQVSFKQHDAQWIPKGYPNAGKVVFFNNGGQRVYSSIDVFAPTTHPDGKYLIDGTAPFGPSNYEWSYTAPTQSDFFSVNMSGVHPLSNGNFLICESTKGHLFEIDKNKNTVWDYVNPVTLFGPIKQGNRAAGNQVFRGYRYGVDFSGFKNKKIIEGDRIEIDPLPILCDDTTSSGGGTGGNDTTHTAVLDLDREGVYTYPNPVKRYLNVITSSTKYNIVLVNAIGQVVLEQDGIEMEMSMDLESLEPGFYHIRVESGDIQKVYSRKLLKL